MADFAVRFNKRCGVVTYAVDRGPYKQDPYDQQRPISVFMNGGRGYASADAPWNALISALDVGGGGIRGRVDIRY